MSSEFIRIFLTSMCLTYVGKMCFFSVIRSPYVILSYSRFKKGYINKMLYRTWECIWHADRGLKFASQI